VSHIAPCRARFRELIASTCTSVNATFAAKQITKHRRTVALKAIRFVRQNIDRCFRALSVIESARAELKRNITRPAAPKPAPRPAQRAPKAVRRANKQARRVNKKARRIIKKAGRVQRRLAKKTARVQRKTARKIAGARRVAQKRVRKFANKAVKKAKAAQLGNETIALARRVDVLKKKLIGDARRVDQNKTASELARRDISEINRLATAVRVELARTRAALGKKLISRKAFQRELNALKILLRELRKCRQAANVIVKNRQRVKRTAEAAVIRARPAGVIKAWIFNDTIRLAAEIDRTKNILVEEAKRVDTAKDVSAMVRNTIASIETLAKRVAVERTR
jgi:hypothetical protein